MHKPPLYSDQGRQLSLMQMKTHCAFYTPTGTGKGHVIATDYASRDASIAVVSSHRILLSQELGVRCVQACRDSKPGGIRRMYIHSGDPSEYGMDEVEDKIWLEQFPDEGCTTIEHIVRVIESAKKLNQQLLISVTYHSLWKLLAALTSTQQKGDVFYADEIHVPVNNEAQYDSLKNVPDLFTNTYLFSATPGAKGSRIRNKIESIFGEECHEMSIKDAIAAGLIAKPRWVVTEVDGERNRHIAQGVIQAFEEYQSITGKPSASAIVHTNGTQEIASIDDSKQMKTLLSTMPNLMVAEISSSRGPRIRMKGVTLTESELKMKNANNNARLEWLSKIKQHDGPLLVLHIDICNAGIDVPGFEFGLWTYFPGSEVYVVQGNGRSGRLDPADRSNLEQGNISPTDYSEWVKPYNNVGLLVFNDTVVDEQSEFIEFIRRSRDVGFNPTETVHTTRKGDKKLDGEEGEQKGATPQSSLPIHIITTIEEADRVSKIDERGGKITEQEMDTLFDDMMKA